MSIILNTPDQITRYRHMALLAALQMEIRGMKMRGRSAYSIIKKEFCLHGNKQKVYDQFRQMVMG